MEVPYEILQNIFKHLDTKDKLSCSIVCKEWHRPAFESLYTKVQITSLRAFRGFLYTISHNDLNLGNKVKILILYTEDNFDQTYNSIRPITMTEFEVLAHNCPSLEELYFVDLIYWRYISMLDLKSTWLKLNRIPPVCANRDAINVYFHIASRLNNLEVCYPMLPVDFAFLLSVMTQLKTLTLNRFTLDPINLAILNTIHSKSPQLQHVCFKTLIGQGIPQEPVDLPPISSLKSLACHIYSPNSFWFSIIQSNYSKIPTLSLSVHPHTVPYNLQMQDYLPGFMQINNTDESYTDETTERSDFLSTTAARYLEPILNLYEHTEVKHIHVLYRFHYPLSKLKTLLFMLVHKKNVLQPNNTISFDFCYSIEDSNNWEFRFMNRPFIDSMTSDMFLRVSTTKTINKIDSEQKVHHTVRYQSASPYPFIEDITSLFNYLFEKSIDQVTELNLRKNTYQYSNKKHILYLDQILHQFSQLQQLTISSQYKDIDNRNFERDINAFKFSISQVGATKKSHPHLKQITMKNVKIHAYVFTFLFQFCPQLEELSVIHCDLEEETLLALEYLCFKNKILFFHVF